MNKAIFHTPGQFQNAFAGGLERMLQHEGLGVFILVCANAGFDPRLWSSLKEKLQRRYQEHAGQYREALLCGQRLPDAEDDVMVFLKLLAIGFDSLQLTERRMEGPWELQFNQLRSFRPPRMAQQKVASLHAPFNEEGFHFNKPYLRKECFWAGSLLGREVELLYNKFPFADYHGLLVPQRENNAPQYLTQDDHRYLWLVCESLGESLPGIGFGYNAYGAYSSVNHLHFQMFLRQAPLPVQSSVWLHNGGTVSYPLCGERFGHWQKAWRYIESLHQNNIAYNLLYLPGEIYCLPRRMQGGYQHADWTGGFAWYEVCGGMVTFNRQQYATLRAETIEQELAKLRLP